MKILFIVTRNPLKNGSADQITTYHAISYLKQIGKDVHLCVLYATPFSNIFSWISIIFRAIFLGIPLQVGMYYNTRNIQLITNLLNKHLYFERVYVHLIRGMVASKLIDKKEIYLGMQLSQGLNFSRIAKELPFGFKKLLYKFESKLCYQYEKQISKRVKKVNFVGTTDISYLKLKNLTSVTMVPHGISQTFKNPTNIIGDLIFLSNLKSEANQAACIFLVTKVMPIIVKSYPDITLSICGKNTPCSFYNFANKNIRVVGEVDNALVAVAKHRICLNPVVAAAGMQNKVLTGLASGVPVITIEQAVAGMALPYETCFKTQSDSYSFATEVLRVLENYPTDATLQDVKSRVKKDWSWDHLHAKWTRDFLDLETS